MKSQALGYLKVLLWTGGGIVVTLFLLALLVNRQEEYEYNHGFKQQDWLAVGKELRKDTADMGGVSTGNRESMIKDLMAHYLKLGMTRAQVVALLGPPERERVEMVVPDSVALPDSLDWSRMSGKEILKQGTEGFNKWHEQHAQPDTILRYQVGWDVIDPTSMRVELDGKGRLKRAWVGVH